MAPVDVPVVGPDEVVEFRRPGRRGPRSRWLLAGAVLAAVGALVGVLLTRGGGYPVAAPSSRPVASRVPSVSSAVPGAGGQPIGLLTPAPAVDLVLGEHGLYVLQADGVVSRVDGGSLLGNDTVPAGASIAQRLFVDEPAQRSWLVASAATSTVQITSGEPGVTVSRVIRVPAQVSDGALFGGRLWLATSAGIYVLGPDDVAAARVPAYAGATIAIAADPLRQRLIATSSGWPTRMLQVRAGRVTVLPGSLLLGKTSIAVSANQIWLTGYGDGPHVLHLDPTTLQPFAVSPVDPQVGPGAQVWAGGSVVWVRDGGSEGLSCVDAATGEVRADWSNVSGPVASRAGAGYAVADGAVIRLELSPACPG